MTERIATRERCGICHRISAVGFWVPNEVWAAVVHHSRLHDIHCLACFADHADAAMVDWAAEIKFYPVSLVSHLRGDDPSERGMLDPSAGSATVPNWEAIATRLYRRLAEIADAVGTQAVHAKVRRLEVEEVLAEYVAALSAGGPGDDKCPAGCTDPYPSSCRNGTINSPCRCAICHGHIPGFSTVDMAGFVYDCPRCSPLFGVCVKHRFSPGDNELKSGEQGGMGEPGAIRTAPDVAGTTESQDGGVSSARPAVPASPSLSSPDAGQEWVTEPLCATCSKERSHPVHDAHRELGHPFKDSGVDSHRLSAPDVPVAKPCKCGDSTRQAVFVHNHERCWAAPLDTVKDEVRAQATGSATVDRERLHRVAQGVWVDGQKGGAYEPKSLIYWLVENVINEVERQLSAGSQGCAHAYTEDANGPVCGKCGERG